MFAFLSSIEYEDRVLGEEPATKEPNSDSEWGIPQSSVVVLFQRNLRSEPRFITDGC